MGGMDNVVLSAADAVASVIFNPLSINHKQNNFNARFKDSILK